MNHDPIIETLLPHRGTAIVVDRIISHAKDEIQCERTVRQDEHYGPGLTPEGLIEFCAQSAILCELSNGKGAGKIGVIAGIDGFSFAMAADIGDILIAHIKTVTRMGNLSMFDCTVRRNDEQICQGTIKAALT